MKTEGKSDLIAAITAFLAPPSDFFIAFCYSKNQGDLKVMMNKIYVRYFLFHILILIGICSLTGLLSNLWWFFDLFNHFRPQALLTTACIFPISLWLKDKKCIILSLAIITINSTLIIERLYAFPAAPNPNQVSYFEGKTQNISVMFSNVLTSNLFHQPLLDTISNNNPDILVITEIDKKWENALATKKTPYAYSIVIPRSDNFGIAVYSKLPFTSKRYDVGNYQLPLLMLDFGTFTLIAAHPIPPLNRKNAEELHVYMRKIAEIANSTQKPLILVGDFNTTIWSDTINDLHNTGLMRTNQLGLAWTWPSGFFPLAIQIDHIFVRDAIMADFKVLPHIGSDHFPVKSNITIHTLQDNLKG